MKRIALLAVLAAPLATVGFAASAQTIAVEQAWARATSPSQSVGGVFLTLTDNGGDDALVSAASPVAKSVELHETVNDNGVMKMQPIPSLKLTHGQSVTLQPGQYHLMAMGLKQQLKPGDTFPVTLAFAHAAPVTATVTVQAAGASGPGDAMGGMDHSSMGGMQMNGMQMDKPKQ
jgi:periplasmic copper chaperone A